MTQNNAKSRRSKDFVILEYRDFLGEPKQTKRGLRYKCPSCGEYHLAIDKDGIKYDCHNCHETNRIAYLLREQNGEFKSNENSKHAISSNRSNQNGQSPSKTTKKTELTDFIKTTYPELRYNIHSREVYLGNQPFSEKVCKLERLHVHIADKYRKDFGKENCIDAVMLHAERKPFNPLADYLRACKKKFEAMFKDTDNPLNTCIEEANKTLSALSTTFLHTENKLYDQYLKLFILSAVGRALSSGCYVRHVLILQGEQGIGKTTFFSILGDEWFSNSLSEAKGKDELMIAIKHWVIEWGELEHIWGKKTVEVVKAFITRTKDDLRLPYCRDIESIPRGFVLCGSTNKTEFLTDDTGNDRFWVIPVPKEIDLINWKMAREEVLGASCFLIDLELKTNPDRIKSGDFWKLPKDFYQSNLTNTKQFEEGDDWENILQPFLEPQKENSEGGWVKAHLIWQHLGIDEKDWKKLSTQLGKTMRRLGWQNAPHRFQGKPLRAWKYKGEK